MYFYLYLYLYLSLYLSLYLAACDAADVGGCGPQQQPADDAQRGVVLPALVVVVVVFCIRIFTCLCLCVNIWLHVTQLMLVVGRSSEQTMPSGGSYSLP